MKLRPLPLLAAVLGVLFTFTAFCAAAEDEAKAPHKKTLWDQIQDGGWVMVPIGLCSVFTVYLIGDGIMRTGPGRITPGKTQEKLKELFRGGDYVGAYQYCRDNPSPLANVVRIGVMTLGEGKEISDESMFGEVSKENSKIQTWISYLSVVGVCTPMIGLLGTVTGMIKAFDRLGTAMGDPAGLSAAIGEVLVATASGLFIAIPAFGAYFFLRNRATAAMHTLQEAVHTLFRKMPYESFAGAHIGDEELYAAQPHWVTSAQPQAETEEEKKNG